MDFQNVNDQLTQLQTWCNNNSKQEFYHFFSTTLENAKKRYGTSKRHAWSFPENMVTIIAFVATPVIFSILTYILEQYKNISYVGKFGLYVFLLAVYVTLSCLLQWQQKKNASETWVRRSAYYHRLCIALGVFVFSDQRMDDYKRLVQDTFAILEQNLDQFTLNLSPNGLVERRKD